MKDLEGLIRSINEANEEDKKEVHEVSNNLRKLADLFDQLLKEGITAEEVEEIMGKVFVVVIKLKGLI